MCLAEKKLASMAPTLLPSAAGKCESHSVSLQGGTMALGLSANEDDETLGRISKKSQSSKRRTCQPFHEVPQWVTFPTGNTGVDRGGA